MYVYVFGVCVCRQGMVAHTWNPHIQENGQENEKFKPNIYSKFRPQRIITGVLLIIAATTKISVLPCAYIVTKTGQKGSCLLMAAKE